MSETELDDVETLADLADLAREAAEDEETVLVFIEQEDSWFAVVRVDGEEDPRIFVSDAAAASRSAYGEIVLTDELTGRGSGDDLDDLVVELDEDDDTDSADPDEDDDADDEAAALDTDGLPNGPLGDAGLLIDFGVGAKELMDMSVEGSVPGDALTEIADALGCGDVLEAVR
ncbi:tRNA adenosine deaminase-associated protein [Streptacidiphilus cavernicola]|uniref:tRNA adenosine deaminase-associated protein n=1 Tax=Streptacidiphilus cavernicola TaxID=3342716 RepID=A0ABV6VVY1_9ACTN